MAQIPSYSLGSALTGTELFVADQAGVTVKVTSQLIKDYAQRGIHDTPVNGATTISISSNWAYDHEQLTNAHIDWTADQGATNIHINNVQEFGSAQAGVVPASGGGTVNFLRADGSWASPGAAGGSNSFVTHTITDTDSGYTWSATGSAVADTTTDILTWVSGVGVDIDVDATNDAIRISVNEATINHDNLSGFVANEHIDWTNATANLSTTGSIAGSNLSGTNTGDQTITLTGDVTGSGTGSFAATIGANAVTNTKIRDSVGLSVIGRSANTTGDPADMTAGTDGHVLRRSGTTLGFGTIATAGIANNAVTLAKLADIATASFMGRNTAGTGDPEVLTATQATALLNTFSTTTTTKGLVPGSNNVGASYFLNAAGSWAIPSGGSASNSFETITITDTDSGFTWGETGSAVAESSTDTLTLVSGSSIDIDVDATNDAVRISVNEATINHDNLTGFVANEHIDWTSTTANLSTSGTIAGSNLSGTNTGDQTITLTGDVTGSGTGSFAATIANNAVTLAKMADIATARFIGRVTAATGDPEALTGAQATSLLDLFSTTTTTKGLVPGSNNVGASYFLNAAGSWAIPSGGSASNSFETITVTDTDAGHTWAETGSAVAESSTDTLTLVSGAAIDIDVAATTDGIRIAVNEAAINHDNLAGFVANEHIDWTSTTANLSTTGTIAGSNLSGTNTGDQTITLTGDVTGSGTGSFAATIANNAVTLAKMADIATSSFLGRVTASTGDPEVLTATQATALLNTFTTSLKGLTPASGGGTTNFLRADGTWTEAKPIECLIIACSDETSALTTGTAKVTFRMPYAFTLTDIKASLTTAPTGATFIADVNEGGTSIMTTNKLQIEVNEKTTDDAATQPALTDTSLAENAEITVDIDQIGSTVAGAGLKVYLIGRRT